MNMRTTILAIIGLLLAALPGAAQYGGRPGDTVLYVFSSKGSGTVQTLPASTVNTATGFYIIDPPTVTLEPFPPAFPGEFRLVLHNEPGDVFEFLLEQKDVVDPNTETIAPAKVLIGEGMLRISPTGENDIDAPSTFFTTFPQFIEIAPHLALNAPYELVFWTNSQVFPIAIPVPTTFVSPVPPPGVSGPDYIVSQGLFPALTPWQGLNKLFPGVGWLQGTDLKLLERDNSLSTTARLIRLRPGRNTPPFSIDGNTHILVLQGSVQICPAGAQAQTLTRHQYAFVPPGYAITLSNPAVYAGPGSPR
jgi:hypothetical protein